jgi:hypothetical protein
MNMPTNNGKQGTVIGQFESTHYANKELESNWEVQEASHYAYPKMTCEAGALLGAAVPSTVQSMGGQQTLRRVMPSSASTPSLRVERERNRP